MNDSLPANPPASASPDNTTGKSIGARLAAFFMLAVALIALWQLNRLERWSIDGPGPGLFPMLVGTAFAVLAVIVFIWPGPIARSEDDESATASPPGNTARTFALYVLSLLVLAAGSAFAGFTITTLAVSVIIVHFAEGRSWFAAVCYGVIGALIGLVGFGWLLRVDLPSTAIERAFFTWVR